MAYTKLADETHEAAAERAAATRVQSGAVRNGGSERVQYQDRVVEIPQIDHKALGRPVDAQYDRNLASVRSRLKAVGVAPATVINFMPMLLQSTSYIDTLRKARIRPPRPEEDYATFFISQEEIVPTRMGADSPLLAFDIHPIQLADEFVKVCSGMGGVMAFTGTPEDIGTPEWRNHVSEFHGGRTYGDVYEECRHKAIGWMRQQLANGNTKAANPHTIVNILSYEKESARRLLALGDISELPKWVEEQRDITVRRTSCPKCQKPVDPGISQCLNCNFIVDPKLAYEIGAIDENDASLERLTRDTVIEMGISDYVAETIDEKPQRMALGLPKPMSLAAYKVQMSQDELDEVRRKETAKENATLLAGAVKEASKGNAKGGPKGAGEEPAKE